MPSVPIVDAHVHLYDPGRFTYKWLDQAPTLKQSHLPDDFLAAVGSLELAGGLFVEVAAADNQNLDEVRWVTQLAPGSPWLCGVVANALLENGAQVRDELDELTQNPLVHGIRRIVASPPRADPDFCLTPRFLEGMRILEEYGLAFDLGVQRGDLKRAQQLVASCPGVRFVVDHMANPDIRGGEIESWRRDLSELARAPNVYCKVSGMIPNAGGAWTVDALTPYFDVAIEAFGFGRVMFGSDWPLMNAFGADYRRWVDAVCRMMHGCSRSEERQLFSETAIHFYRLNRSSATDGLD